MQDLQLELAGEYMVMAATLAEIKSRMLLPRPPVLGDGTEEDPRAELVRRLQEYERFKRAAEDIDTIPRLERDTWVASAELKDRKVVRLLPQVTLQEMLVAFRDVVVRSEMFAHHHIQRERLSVRARMGDILSSLERSSFVEFVNLFRAEEGRMGITVTFVAILELVREGFIDIVQAEPFAPLHVRAAAPNRNLRLVAGQEAANEEAVEPTGPVTAESARIVVESVEAAHVALSDDFVDDSDEEDESLPGVDDVVPVSEALAQPEGLTEPQALTQGEPLTPSDALAQADAPRDADAQPTSSATLAQADAPHDADAQPTSSATLAQADAPPDADAQPPAAHAIAPEDASALEDPGASPDAPKTDTPDEASS
jgi:segregation and condensation protein A